MHTINPPRNDGSLAIVLSFPCSAAGERCQDLGGPKSHRSDVYFVFVPPSLSHAQQRPLFFAPKERALLLRSFSIVKEDSISLWFGFHDSILYLGRCVFFLSPAGLALNNNIPLSPQPDELNSRPSVYMYVCAWIWWYFAIGMLSFQRVLRLLWLSDFWRRESSFN